jgi:hypothetical protein
VLRQDDRGIDGQREAHWFGDRGDYRHGRSRFRYATREGRFSRERSWDSHASGRPFYSRSRNPSREDGAVVHRMEGRRWSRPHNSKHVAVKHAAVA